MLDKALRMALACLLGASLSMSVLVRQLNAQVLYGSVTGTVSDQSGGVVPSAHVTATSTATGLKREVQTDASGHYSIGDLPPGSYDLNVSGSGFKPLTQTNVQVTANTVTRIDLQLQLGTVSQQVTVEATAAVLQTEKTDVHTTLGAIVVQNLPLNQYRNFQALIN